MIKSIYSHSRGSVLPSAAANSQKWIALVAFSALYEASDIGY